MKKILILSIVIMFCTQLQAQWTNTSHNYTTGQLGIGAPGTWAPITIHSISNSPGNIGVSLAFDGTNHSEIGYRFKANGSNYYQVLYDGSTINWKHYEGGSYISKLSLTNSGFLGIGTVNPSAELEVKSVSNNNAEIHINSSTNGKPSIIRFQDAGTTTWGLLSHYPNPDKLSIYNYHNNSNAMVFDINGNVGIGTANPNGWKLSVNGQIRAKEIKVETGWSDFVFYDDYKLPTLQEVENYIKEKGHLKDIPSAKDVEENGIYLGEMDSKLLQKIEELTLYTLQQEKKINKIEKENESLKLLATEFLKLQKRLEKLEKSK